MHEDSADHGCSKQHRARHIMTLVVERVLVCFDMSCDITWDVVGHHVMCHVTFPYSEMPQDCTTRESFLNI